MAPPVKSVATQGHGFAADPPGANPPSNNLWIGNVSPDVSDAELKALLEKHGKTDSVTTYPTRNYAFAYFKEIDGAISAKQVLQGYVLRGNPLKIEFAKPVGGLLSIFRVFHLLRFCLRILLLEPRWSRFLEFFSYFSFSKRVSGY